MTDPKTKTEKKSFRIKSALTLIAVLIVAAASYSKLTSRPSKFKTFRATYTVQRRDLTVSVTESGEIKARESTDIKSQVEGRTTIISIVPEGTVITQEDVKNGKILCELDSSELKERFTQQEITFANAEANYTEAKESYDIRLNQNESDIKADELKVQFAMMDLQKYLGEKLVRKLIDLSAQQEISDTLISDLIEDMTRDPNDPRWDGAALQDKRVWESNIKLAKGRLERDRNQLRGTKKLYAKEYVAFSELERDQLNYDSSEIELVKSKTTLELFLRYDFPKEVEKLFSDYQESQRQLQRTLAKTRSQLAQAQAKLNSAKATFNLQKERRENWKKQLESCVIKATTIGMVVYGTSGSSFSRRQNPIEEGSEVYERQKIFTIPNTTEMAAEVQVHESWVDKVVPNLPVKVTIDAFPDDVFSGKVLKIAPLPDPQHRWMNTGLKVYTTEVGIEGRHNNLKPGMSAKVEIVIRELQNVLCVPVQAVVNREGYKACYLVTPSGLKMQKVKTGAFNDSLIEIIEGLSEQDAISLIPPSLTEQFETQKKTKNKKPPSDNVEDRRPKTNQPSKMSRPPKTNQLPESGQQRRRAGDNNTERPKRRGVTEK